MTIRDDIHAIELRQAKAIAFIRGALVIGAILLTCVQWYALRQLDYLVTQGKAVALHEQRLTRLETAIPCKPDAQPDPDRAIK